MYSKANGDVDMNKNENTEWSLVCVSMGVGTAAGLIMGVGCGNLSVGLTAGAAIGLLIGLAGYAVDKVREC